jgi:ComF family protein
MMEQPLKPVPWYHSVLDFVFPPLCLGCGAYVESGDPVCAACDDAIDTFSSAICLSCGQNVMAGAGCPVCGDDSFLLYAFADYVDPMKEIIHQFKFKGITSPAGIFARRLCDEFGQQIMSLKPGALVPIPLHGSREYVRGYNQAVLIAIELGRALEIPVDQETLYRAKRRRPQSRLRQIERAKNISEVFAVSREPESGERVILVDDVVTSGATVREARRELQETGFDVPAVIALAHGV